MKKRALITGVTGQIGSYLAEYLLELDYTVYGLLRRRASPATTNLDWHGITDKIHFMSGDLSDDISLQRVLNELATGVDRGYDSKDSPLEVYHLAAMSHVPTSFSQPLYTIDITGTGTLRLLETIYQICPDVRVYIACSSEIFGDAPAPQNEKTPFSPRSPYAAAKALSLHLARIYREGYGLFVACGIVFNTESPLRDEEFVTRKITKSLARIKFGLQDRLILGNLDAERDWMWCDDTVNGIYKILQYPHPNDFVLATGESHSVREFVELACEYADVPLTCVETSRSLYRPLEVPLLRGDASKAHQLLEWEPKVRFPELVRRMVEHDLLIEETKKKSLKENVPW